MSEGPNHYYKKIPEEDALLKPEKTLNLTLNLTTGNTEDENKTNCFHELESLPRKYPRNIVVGYININSIRNKLDNLSMMISDNIDILIITETKIDSSFTSSQFQIEGYKIPFRLDISERSGGILVYVKDNLITKELKVTLKHDIQAVYFELNLRKYKWLIVTIYRPPQQDLKYFVEQLSYILDQYQCYENVVVIGDFNAEPNEKKLSPLIEDYNLYNLIKNPTCFKSSKGRCIDLVLTNRKHSFMHSKPFETGFSDHHHMIYTILKSTFEKVAPKKITYRDYKAWSLEKFKQELTMNLVITHPTDYTQFENVFMKAIEENAPEKTKIIRANHKHHVNKELRKAIMKRNRLKNIANKTKKDEDIKRYRAQRNLVVNLNTKTKRTYYKSIQAKSIENEKQFWKTVKPLFSNTNPMKEKITLIENGKILANDEEVAECFNEYFINITNGMGIDLSLKEVYDNLTLDEMVVRAVKKYEHHPSIKQIKSINQGTNKFQFSHVNPNEVMRQIEALDKKKSNSGKIPTSVLKATKEDVCPFLTDCINSAIYNCRFPDELKEANVTPKFKSKDATAKSNYRPISILPSVSKIYERALKNQITPFFQEKLSVILSGFRESYSTQHALIRVLELWRRCLDSSGIVGTILMDLSKAYHCLPHDLLIAKLEAYGFNNDSLQLIFSFLQSRYQRVNIGSYKSR